MAQVVEDHEHVGEHQGHVGQPEHVGVGVTERRLDRPHEVVAEQPDRPTAERRQVVHVPVGADLHQVDDLTVIRVPEAGHFAPWEAPEAVAATVRTARDSVIRVLRGLFGSRKDK